MKSVHPAKKIEIIAKALLINPLLTDVALLTLQIVQFFYQFLLIMQSGSYGFQQLLDLQGNILVLCILLSFLAYESGIGFTAGVFEQGCKCLL